jgi:hypothetical protein
MADDIYEQERQAREMDKAHADREKNYEYCNVCKIWVSRYLTHSCEEYSKWIDLGKRRPPNGENKE